MRHGRRTGIGGGSSVATALAADTASQAGRHRKVSRPGRTVTLVVEGDRLVGPVSEGSLLRYERRRALGCA